MASRVATAAAAVALASLVAATPASAAIASLAGLTAIEFTEYSGFGSTYSFLPGSGNITTRISGPMNLGTPDFVGLPNELYDVFFSDANGAFNVNGDYITIEAQYSGVTGGGGLNIDAVALVFGGTRLYATTLASFVGANSNYLVGSATRALGAPDALATAMGNTGSFSIVNNERLRVTVGFQAEVPEPSTYALLGLGLGMLGFMARRSRKA